MLPVALMGSPEWPPITLVPSCLHVKVWCTAVVYTAPPSHTQLYFAAHYSHAAPCCVRQRSIARSHRPSQHTPHNSHACAPAITGTLTYCHSAPQRTPCLPARMHCQPCKLPTKLSLMLPVPAYAAVHTPMVAPGMGTVTVHAAPLQHVFLAEVSGLSGGSGEVSSVHSPPRATQVSAGSELLETQVPYSCPGRGSGPASHVAEPQH
mmetsp:Transcript_3645/g.9124  ORF Transcript_3645/g.9124 Transcript_3645/m.9124 type:complete len:207 (+) Transcript_3645:202-822(+)